MNAYQISSIETSNEKDFIAVCLAALLAADFDISKGINGVVKSGPEEGTILVGNVLSFQLDFSLLNYGSVNDVPDSGINGIKSGVVQLVSNSQMTKTKELSFKPYAVKGYKVLILQGASSSMSGLLVDLEKDYTTFMITGTEGATRKEMRVIIGTANSTQSDTYKPFEKAFTDYGVEHLKFFADSDLIDVIKNQCQANIKPFINPQSFSAYGKLPNSKFEY
ncbi:MAG: hypothetical protein [Circular genetic element sp.]|nr:MAG: hypothetical protein [Circular genetic element sp.]